MSIDVLYKFHLCPLAITDADVSREEVRSHLAEKLLKRSGVGRMTIDGHESHMVELTAAGHDQLRRFGLCRCPLGTGGY